MRLAIDEFDPKRFGLVTGSNCTPLFPVRSAEKGQRTLAKKLAYERHFKFYDELSTWQMEHGHDNEEFALEYCHTFFDKTVKKGRFIQVGEAGGTMDAEGDGVWDWKCPVTMQGWLSYLYDGMSDKEENQMQMYMFLSGKRKARIGAFLMETWKMTDNGLVYPILKNKRMIVCETKVNPDWVIKLKKNLPKVVEMRDEYINQLKKQFG